MSNPYASPQAGGASRGPAQQGAPDRPSGQRLPAQASPRAQEVLARHKDRAKKVNRQRSENSRGRTDPGGRPSWAPGERGRSAEAHARRDARRQERGTDTAAGSPSSGGGNGSSYAPPNLPSQASPVARAVTAADPSVERGRSSAALMGRLQGTAAQPEAPAVVRPPMPGMGDYHPRRPQTPTPVGYGAGVQVSRGR